MLRQKVNCGECGGPEKGRFELTVSGYRLTGASVFGDGLGALADSVLGQFTGQEEADGGLDLSAGDGGTLVVVGQARGLVGDALEDVVDKGVHDIHGFAGDSSVGVDLLQHFVDVNAVALPPPTSAFLVAGAHGLCLGGGLLGSLRCWSFWWHDD